MEKTVHLKSSLDHEWEQSLLGCLLIKPEKLREILSLVRSEDFSEPRHRIVYQVMRDLSNQGSPVDLVTVTQRLREQQLMEMPAGALFVAELWEETFTAANIKFYAEKVREKAQIRELAKRTKEIGELCSRANGNAKDLLLYAESQILEVTNDINLEIETITESLFLIKDYSSEEPIIANGILPKGGGMIIAGESGEGKSLLRLELAIHIALGWDLWGLDIPRARKVLTLQFENTEQIEQYRLKQMLLGLGVNNCFNNLLFPYPSFRLNLGEKEDQARLIQLISKTKAEIVIYDPLTSLHRINENDNVAMRAVLDTISEVNRETGAAALVIHHYGKPDRDGGNSGHRTRGASSIKDWCDTLVGVSRKKGETILRTLEFLKVRNGPEPKPMTLERSKETFLHTVTEGGDSLCPPGRVREILESLGGEVDSQKDLRNAIMEETGVANRRAWHFIRKALEFETIFEKPHPTNWKKKIYTLDQN